MYTTTWCGYCVRLKTQMQREGIAFTEVNIELDEEAAEFVGSVNGGNHVVPTLLLPDGATLTNPSIHQLKAALS
jgi:mycoredoxin